MYILLGKEMLYRGSNKGSHMHPWKLPNEFIKQLLNVDVLLATNITPRANNEDESPYYRDDYATKMVEENPLISRYNFLLCLHASALWYHYISQDTIIVSFHLLNSNTLVRRYNCSIMCGGVCPPYKNK